MVSLLQNWHRTGLPKEGCDHVPTDETERLAFTKRLGMKYYPTAEEVDAEIARDMPRMLLIRIDIEHLTGKHVRER